MKKLFICEKPSLAKALAECLATSSGKLERHDGYYHVGDNYVAWLKGHIMALYEPGDYKEEWLPENISYEHLPMFPEKFKKKIKTSFGRDAKGKERKTKDYEKIFAMLQSLVKYVDVLVNSGDADAEGQILCDEVIEALGWYGPVERIYITAYDNITILRALNNMEDNRSAKVQNVSKAAECRAITDWLIGMNGSRKFGLDIGQKVSVGRVKVPIMALIKRRNEAIANFKSVEYYEPVLYAKFGNSVPFPAVWKAKDDSKGLDEEGRLVDVTQAREIVQKIASKSVVVVDEVKKHQVENPPLPFSLAKLQEYACSKLNVSLKELDSVLQTLYEEKKLVTYPRSDCQYVPESQYSDGYDIVRNLMVAGSDDLNRLAAKADCSLKSKAFDTSKTSAHHAIIPTTVRVDLNKLTEVEAKLYIIIAERYLMQFYPAYEYDTTEITLEAENETFVAKGNIVTAIGWKAVQKDEDKKTDGDKLSYLPELAVGETGAVMTPQLAEKHTTPPKYFTQESLINALTNAYKYVDNKSLADVIKSIKGIGTPATRSSIIESMINSKLLLERPLKEKGKKKYLFVSDKASRLVDSLPKTLTYPDQTALMELDLEKIAAGEMSVAEYKQKIEAYILELMKVQAVYEKPIKCLICGEGYLRKNKFGKWSCSNWRNGCKALFEDVDDKPYTEKCPACGKGFMRKSKNNHWYCTEFKDCKSFFKEEAGKSVLSSKE